MIWSLYQDRYITEGCVTHFNTDANPRAQHTVKTTQQHPVVPCKTRPYVNDHGTFDRPMLEYVFMNLAVNLASRSTCLRTKVGAVFTDAAMTRVFSVGYNGDAKGGKNQCDSVEVGNCGCVHAEANALTKNNVDITGCTCFLTLSPCTVCAKLLINREIGKLVYLEQYRDPAGLQLLNNRGIEIVKYDDL